MKDFLRQHFQLFVIFIIWTVIGIAAAPLAYVVIPLTCLLLLRKDRFLEVFFGLIYIVILSDSRFLVFNFAKNVKEIYFLIMGIYLFLNQDKFAPFNKLINPFAGFFIIASISTFFNPAPFLSFQKLLSYFFLYLLIPNYIAKLYNEHPRFFLKNFIYFIVFLLVISVLLYFPLSDLLSIEGRYFGIFGNPNALGLFSSIAFIIIAVIFNLEPDLLRPKQKLFVYSILILNILLCRSRTSMITVTMFLIFSTTFKRSTLLGFVSVAITFILNAYISDILQSIASSFNLGEFLRLKDIEKGSGRLVAWMFGWDVIQNESFFIGKGFNYTNYIYQINYKRLSLMGHQGNAHNSFITFWIDTGIVGLILFLYGYIKSFLSASYHTRLALPAMFAFGFSMFFESWFCASLNPFTFQVIIILTIIRLKRVNVLESIYKEGGSVDNAILLPTQP